MNIFLGYEDFVDIFLFFFFLGGGGHHKIGLYLGGNFYAFKCLFLMSRHRIGDIFFGMLKFQRFLGYV